MAKQNQAILTIRKSMASSRYRHSWLVLIEGIEKSSPPIAGRLVELQSGVYSCRVKSVQRTMTKVVSR